MSEKNYKKKESGRVPFTDSKWSSVEVEMELRFYIPYKIAMELGALFELHFIPTTTFRQPEWPAPPTTTPPP
jgi:hypothetical protein